MGRRLVNRFFEGVVELIPARVSTALEVGCGAGFSTERIKRARPGVLLTASDVDPRLVKLARNRLPDVPMAVESAYNLARPTGAVDLVLALEVLEHLEEPDVAMGEIWRVTRELAIISVPREPLWRMLNIGRGKYLRDLGNTPGHVNHWTGRGMRRFVSKLFEIKEIRMPLPWVVTLLAKRAHGT